jgi:hypothetical protein
VMGTSNIEETAGISVTQYLLFFKCKQVTFYNIIYLTHILTLYLHISNIIGYNYSFL